MRKTWKHYLVYTIVLIIFAFLAMAFANFFQTGFGRIKVSKGFINNDKGMLAYKLYVPKSASTAKPAPAVLLLHGYQNDRETSAAYAIELARRGAVVMCLDAYGHGNSSIGLAERGYVNHKLNVPYGMDSDGNKSFVGIKGPARYKIMMNFSNLSFFKPRYARDNDGNYMLDSSMGGITAYKVLSELELVDPSRMGVSGHSMGTWSSWSVAAAYSGAVNRDGVDISPKAIVLQCGELFTKDAYDSDSIKFNNVLLLQAKYDEFACFRDYANTISDKLLHSGLRSGFLGTTYEAAQWNSSFGNFSDGSARRMELLQTNHRLVTCSSQGIAAAINWFGNSIGIDSEILPKNQIFLGKECFSMLAMLLAIAASLAFMELLLCIPFFASVKQKLPEESKMIKEPKAFWKASTITILIAGLTYPFMTQLGHGLLPLPESIFRLTVGNGFIGWYSLLILIMLATTALAVKKAKKNGSAITYYDLGLSSGSKKDKIDWILCAKSALLAFLMFSLIYVILAISEAIFFVDFRFIWPVFKNFSRPRPMQFLVYIPIFALFFILNNSKVFAQMRVKDLTRPGFKGFFASWWKYALCMAGGLLLLAVIEYLPFFLGLGPGIDLLFTPLFGGPFISLLIVFIPQVLVFSVICTYAFRNSGSIYTGAFLVAMLACQVVSGGSTFM